MNAAVDLMRRLYRPDPKVDLQDLAEGLHAQLTNLMMDPSPERCETVAANLDGARRAILRLRASLMEVHDE